MSNLVINYTAVYAEIEHVTATRDADTPIEEIQQVLS